MGGAARRIELFCWWGCVSGQMLDTRHNSFKGPIQPQLKPGWRIQPCALPDGRYQTKAFGYIN